jgi:hypothetical protein
MAAMTSTFLGSAVAVKAPVKVAAKKAVAPVASLDGLKKVRALPITKKPIGPISRARAWIRMTRVRRSMPRRARDARFDAERVARDRVRSERPVADASRVARLDGRARRTARRGPRPEKPPSDAKR